MSASDAGLRAWQIGALIAIGAALWLLAAIVLRIIGPLGAFDGWNRALLYGLVIPVTAPFVLATCWLARLRPDQCAAAIAMVTATALLLDGVAVAWFPQLYGRTDALRLGASAAILWGAGVGLVLGFACNRPRQSDAMGS